MKEELISLRQSFSKISVGLSSLIQIEADKEAYYDGKYRAYMYASEAVEELDLEKALKFLKERREHYQRLKSYTQQPEVVASFLETMEIYIFPVLNSLKEKISQ
jgi:hypothetical protein